MPAYDAVWFTPPAPLALVILRNPVSGDTLSDVPMLIDTGADVSLLPAPFLPQIGAVVEAGSGYEVIAFDGARSFAQSVQLDLLFLKRSFKGRFLVINQEWGILGRDILNHLTICLDGPRLRWNEGNGPSK